VPLAVLPCTTVPFMAIDNIFAYLKQQASTQQRSDLDATACRTIHALLLHAYGATGTEGSEGYQVAITRIITGNNSGNDIPACRITASYPSAREIIWRLDGWDDHQIAWLNLQRIIFPALQCLRDSLTDTDLEPYPGPEQDFATVRLAVGAVALLIDMNETQLNQAQAAQANTPAAVGASSEEEKSPDFEPTKAIILSFLDQRPAGPSLSTDDRNDLRNLQTELNAVSAERKAFLAAIANIIQEECVPLRSDADSAEPNQHMQWTIVNWLKLASVAQIETAIVDIPNNNLRSRRHLLLEQVLMPGDASYSRSPFPSEARPRRGWDAAAGEGGVAPRNSKR
jgi:hypothetical protein